MGSSHKHRPSLLRIGTVLAAWAAALSPAANWTVISAQLATTPTFVRQAKLTASDGTEADGFGTSVAVSGNITVVGAPLADALGVDSGAAYVFRRRANGTWREVAKLTPSDGLANRVFGTSVSISGDTAIIGARGAAYVFTRTRLDDAVDWIEEAKLVPPDAVGVDRSFGRSVSISGDTAVVGAAGVGPLTAAGPFGAAYVFQRARREPNDWRSVARLDAVPDSPTDPPDAIGFSVDIDRNTIVVGALGDPGSLFTQHPAIYFFERMGRRSAEWRQVHKESLLAVSGPDIVSPALVSINGNSAVATNEGEPWDNHLYERAPGGPEPWRRAIDGFQIPGINCSVTSHDVDGDVVVAGSSRFGCDLALVIARVTTVGGAAWMSAGTITGDAPGTESFGASVSVNGNTILVGAPRADDQHVDAGAVYVYVSDEVGTTLAP